MPLFRKKKVLCTLGVGSHEELLALARPGFADYARRHGYELVAETQSLAPDRPPSWSKVLLIQRLMKRFRTVVWIDCDAIITDPREDILDALPREATLGMVAHETPEGKEIPNLGVMVIRSNRHAREFFELLWQQTGFLHHKWWENGAALALFGYSTEAPVTLVAPTPMRRILHLLDGSWNALSNVPSTSPRIVHFAGQSHAVRVSEMARLAPSSLAART